MSSFLKNIINFDGFSYFETSDFEIIKVIVELAYRKFLFYCVCAYKGNLDCKHIHRMHLALLVDCYAFINRL